MKAPKWFGLGRLVYVITNDVFKFDADRIEEQEGEIVQTIAIKQNGREVDVAAVFRREDPNV